MKGFKPLTFKEIKKRHVNIPKDKKLQEAIENRLIDKSIFNKLIKEGTKHQPFDKKNRS